MFESNSVVKISMFHYLIMITWKYHLFSCKNSHRDTHATKTLIFYGKNVISIEEVIIISQRDLTPCDVKGKFCANNPAFEVISHLLGNLVMRNFIKEYGSEGVIVVVIRLMLFFILLSAYNVIWLYPKIRNIIPS